MNENDQVCCIDDDSTTASGGRKTDTIPKSSDEKWMKLRLSSIGLDPTTICTSHLLHVGDSFVIGVHLSVIHEDLLHRQPLLSVLMYEFANGPGV